MKDQYTPVGTPFALQHGNFRPSGSTFHDYFETKVQQKLGEAVLDDSTGDERDAPEYLGSILERIPNEILSLIFEQGYFGGPEENLCNNSFRFRASLVSRKMRNVVLHTPSLWSVIQLSPGSIDAQLAFLPTLLRRSKDYPLHIVLNCFWTAHHGELLMAHLVQESHRWQRFIITTFDDTILHLLKGIPVPHLKELSISHFSGSRRIAVPSSFLSGSLPRLSTLSLRNIDIDGLEFTLDELTTLEIKGYGFWPEHAQLVTFFDKCRSLTNLVVFIKPREVLDQIRASNTSHTHITPINIPTLREMTIWTTEWLSEDLVRFVQLFHTPHVGLNVMDSNDNLCILRYRPGLGVYDNPSASLSIFGANIDHAYRALAPHCPITELELRKPHWPTRSQFRHVFHCLKHLQKLRFVDLSVDDAVRCLQRSDSEEVANFYPSRDEAMVMPSLVYLDIHLFSQGTADLEQFLAYFDFPALESFALARSTTQSWESTLKFFRERGASSVKSLRLVDMTESEDMMGTSARLSPSDVFPQLRYLSLEGVACNGFIRHLAFTDPGVDKPWSHLSCIQLAGDDNASRPLLHRALTNLSRREKSLQTLVLDERFTRNQESWEWMKEHVGELMLYESLVRDTQA